MTMPNSATPRLCTPADPTAVKPTEAEVARAIFGAQERDWRSWAHTQQEPYLKAARAVLALFEGVGR